MGKRPRKRAIREGKEAGSNVNGRLRRLSPMARRSFSGKKVLRERPRKKKEDEKRESCDVENFATASFPDPGLEDRLLIISDSFCLKLSIRLLSGPNLREKNKKTSATVTYTEMLYIHVFKQFGEDFYDRIHVQTESIDNS